MLAGSGDADGHGIGTDGNSPRIRQTATHGNGQLRSRLARNSTRARVAQGSPLRGFLYLIFKCVQMCATSLPLQAPLVPRPFSMQRGQTYESS